MNRFRRDDCPPTAPEARGPTLVLTPDEKPRRSVGIDFPGAPRFERHERILVDTGLPNTEGGAAGVPLLIVSTAVGPNETLHLTSWGQRLMARRPGCAEAHSGPIAGYLAGYNLAVQWYLVRKDVRAQNGAVTSAGAALLFGGGGETNIVSPYMHPNRIGVLVQGPAAVELSVRITGTSIIRDKLEEVGGFFEGWRFSQGSIPDDMQWLAIQTAR